MLASASLCVSNDVVVDWQLVQEPPVIIHTRSSSQLQSDFPDVKPPLVTNPPPAILFSIAHALGIDTGTHLDGLTSGGLKTNYQVTGYRTVPSAVNPRLICLSVARVEVVTTYGPTIRIASEYHEGSCPYAIIRAHENKHVARHVEAFNRYVGIMSAALKTEIERIGPQGPYPVQYVNQEKEILEQKVREAMWTAVPPIWQQLEKANTESQNELDTVENYGRDMSACPWHDWQPQ
jgi:hypothetical protein